MNFFLAWFLYTASTSYHLAKFILLSCELTDIESAGWLAFASCKPSGRPTNKLSVVHVLLEGCALSTGLVTCRLIINAEKTRCVIPLLVTNKIFFEISFLLYVALVYGITYESKLGDN